VEKLPICRFAAIQSSLPKNIDELDLSKDQKYLYDICKAVECDAVSQDLKPGPVVHSSWLTTACRILRLYVGTTRPTKNLNILVKFILKVYALMWFEIKNEPSCTNGAPLLWKMTHLTNYLPTKLNVVVQEVIQRNAFYAHPENILVSMLTDEERFIRQLAVKKIIAARKINEAENSMSLDSILILIAM
jgi:hypothetical protein